MAAIIDRELTGKDKKKNPRTKMYELKAIVRLPNSIIQNEIMYKMKPIYNDDDEKSTVPTTNIIIEQKPLSEYFALEARQEKILQQLIELREQVLTLGSYLKHADEDKHSEPIYLDIVINVNPKRPPYSLLALTKCWKDVKVKTQKYTHSSITEGVPENFDVATGSDSLDRKLNLSVVWKNVEELEFVVDVNRRPIKGESNLLRYLDRVLNGEQNYENSGETKRIDKILDLCSRVPYQESQGKIREILAFVGDELLLKQSREYDISDLAVWSIVRNSSIVPQNLKQWYSQCNKSFA